MNLQFEPNPKRGRRGRGRGRGGRAGDASQRQQQQSQDQGKGKGRGRGSGPNYTVSNSMFRKMAAGYEKAQKVQYETVLPIGNQKLFAFSQETKKFVGRDRRYRGIAKVYDGDGERYEASLGPKHAMVQNRTTIEATVDFITAVKPTELSRIDDVLSPIKLNNPSIAIGPLDQRIDVNVAQIGHEVYTIYGNLYRLLRAVPKRIEMMMLDHAVIPPSVGNGLLNHLTKLEAPTVEVAYNIHSKLQYPPTIRKVDNIAKCFHWTSMNYFIANLLESVAKEFHSLASLLYNRDRNACKSAYDVHKWLNAYGQTLLNVYGKQQTPSENDSRAAFKANWPNDEKRVSRRAGLSTQCIQFKEYYEQLSAYNTAAITEEDLKVAKYLISASAAQRERLEKRAQVFAKRNRDEDDGVDQNDQQEQPNASNDDDEEKKESLPASVISRTGNNQVAITEETIDWTERLKLLDQIDEEEEVDPTIRKIRSFFSVATYSPIETLEVERARLDGELQDARELIKSLYRVVDALQTDGHDCVAKHMIKGYDPENAAEAESDQLPEELYRHMLMVGMNRDQPVKVEYPPVHPYRKKGQKEEPVSAASGLKEPPPLDANKPMTVEQQMANDFGGGDIDAM